MHNQQQCQLIFQQYNYQPIFIYLSLSIQMKTIIFVLLSPFFSHEAIIDFSNLHTPLKFPQTFSTQHFNTPTQTFNSGNFNTGNFQFGIGNQYSNGNINFGNNDITEQIRNIGSDSGVTSFESSITSTGNQQFSSGVPGSQSSSTSTGSQQINPSNFNPGNFQTSVGNAYAYGNTYYGNNDIREQIRNSGSNSEITRFESSITSTGSSEFKISNLNTGRFQMGSERFSSESSITSNGRFKSNINFP